MKIVCLGSLWMLISSAFGSVADWENPALTQINKESPVLRKN